MENLMIKKLITLFKLGRKVAKSDILNIISKFQEPPLTIKLLFKILYAHFVEMLILGLIKMKCKFFVHFLQKT